MAVSYRFLDRGRGAEITVFDRLTLTELIGLHTDVFSIRNLVTEPVLYSWFEYGDEVTRVDMSTNELRSAAEAVIRASPQQPIRRVTAVYAKNDVPYTRVKEWKGFIAPIVEVEVFRSKTLALDWLRKRVAELHGFQIEL